MNSAPPQGPLAGTTVIELAGLGPTPFAALMLADMGADVIRIDRPGGTVQPVDGPTAAIVGERGRKSIVVNLKNPGGAAVVNKIAENADVLIEGYRPGVAESLGIGPDDLMAANPRLIYGRMTGWGQEGPLATSAGHDLNYIALSGALGVIGRTGQPPTPPLVLVGDFAGGGMMLAFGVVCALLERGDAGPGQVIDAAIVDGTATMMHAFYAWAKMGGWRQERGTNIIDSGAPFYDSYRTSDDQYIAVGALEPKFYRNFVLGLGLDPECLPGQHDRSAWTHLRSVFTAAIARHPREHWEKVFDGADACVTPVLRLEEVPDHPHHVARGSFVEVGGYIQPVPGPRFSRTPAAVRELGPRPGEHTEQVLAFAGYTAEQIVEMIAAGAVAPVER